MFEQLDKTMTDAAAEAARRKPRAGKSQLADTALMTIAGIYKEGVRENKKQVMTVAVACSIAAQSGIQVPVGNAQVARLMREHRLDRRSQDLVDDVREGAGPHDLKAAAAADGYQADVEEWERAYAAVSGARR